jgi:hypothetical protein
MFVAIIVVVEARALFVRIHDADLDHGVLPDVMFAGCFPAFIGTLRQFRAPRKLAILFNNPNLNTGAPRG